VRRKDYYSTCPAACSVDESWCNNDVIAYCLMAEHTRAHTVVWNGDRGSTYMFQNELPYSGQKAGVRTWGPDQRAYKVTGTQHKGYGLGAYVVVPNWEGDFNPMPNGETAMHFFFEAPGDAKFDRLLGWNNAPGGYRTFLGDAVLLKDGQVWAELSKLRIFGHVLDLTDEAMGFLPPYGYVMTDSM